MLTYNQGEDMAKTHTSTEVKRRYNSKVYLPIHAELPKELVTRFKEKCKRMGVSQASVLKDLIEGFLEDK